MLIVNASLVDTDHGDVVERAWLRIREDGVIADVGSEAPPSSTGEGIVDAEGRFVMPGLIDAHTHMGCPVSPHDVPLLPRAVYAAKVFDEMKATLLAGFTSIRDAGFTDVSFKQAAEQGLVEAPRMTVSNGPLSITGGHSDMRSRIDRKPQEPTDGLYWPGVLVDGVEEVRRGAREVLRSGADHLKIMAGGGCVSTQDDVTDTQFSLEEIRAAVWEAQCRHKYVLAHCYTPEAILNAAEAGVRTVEHGNLLNEAAAEAMASRGMFLVPTMTIYETHISHGQDALSAEQLDKVQRVLASAYDALAVAVDLGVEIGSGSDACSPPSQARKALELEFQARVQGAAGALRSATVVNAEIMERADLGRLDAGCRADLLMVEVNPLEDIASLQRKENIAMIMLDGAVMLDNREWDSSTACD